MNRVVKTAVAVTAFGLAAAALAVPAQAEVRNNTARYAPIDGPAGTTAASSPLGGLLGGLVGGGLLNGVLGASKPKAGAHPGMTEAERDAAVENQEEQVGSANAAEDVTRQGGPLPELSPIIGGMPLGGGGLTESLPILGGAARMAQPATPSVKAGKQSETQPKAIGMNTFGGATGMLESSVGGAMGTLGTTNLLPGTGTSVTDTSSATAKTMNATTRGVETLSADTAIFGVTQATRRALPGATSGELSPVIGQVAPAEMAPVAEALPGTSQAASMDELAPVIDQASGFVAVSGKKATGRYSDVITALGWSTDALTSSVRNSWARD